MKKRLLPFTIALSALSVSASAAFYSVFGLSQLFAGASTEVIIMAGALEAAKLVVASLLYQYWSVINKILRTYLISAVFILMIITSGGIYGFLSGAFEETNTQSEFLDKQVAIIDAKRVRFEEQRDDLKITVKDLNTSLANPTMIQYVDSASGQLVTTTSSRQRKLLQNQLIEAKNVLNNVTDSIAALDIKILEQQIGNESARELGPLKYMSKLTGKPMEQIVNWFMILIVFVFDPLAIAMVVAANMAFAQVKKKNIPEVKFARPKAPIEMNLENKVDFSEVLGKLANLEVKIDAKNEKTYDIYDENVLTEENYEKTRNEIIRKYKIIHNGDLDRLGKISTLNKLKK
tara:strand:- start:3324 stop:4364 length:1041 start_codon:yes stop_codon:yes gene_type:complete